MDLQIGALNEEYVREATDFLLQKKAVKGNKPNSLF